MERGGCTYIQNMRTKQELPLGLGLLNEMEEGKGSLEQVVKKLDQKVLIVHGDKDLAVPLHEGEQLFSWAQNGKLHVVNGADHVFGARHPFQGTTPQLEEAIGVVKKFLNE